MNQLIKLNQVIRKKSIQIKKDPNSTKMNDFLINGGLPVTLYSNMLFYKDSNISFDLDGDLIKTMTNYDFSVSHAIPQDQKLIYEFRKEMSFIIRQKGQKVIEIDL